MKNNSSTGNSLYQYAIIIVLIALALIPIFITFGNQIFATFSYYSNIFANNNQIISNNDHIQIKGGFLGGTTNNPVKKCEHKECIIDFGEYVLTGIPENFDEYIISSGSSGGTDKLADLLMQIANQLEQQGDIEGAKEYQILANLGHFNSDIQESVEKAAKGCQNESDYGHRVYCFGSLITNGHLIANTNVYETSISNNAFRTLTVPNNIADILSDFNSNSVPTNILTQESFIGFAKHTKNNSSSSEFEFQAKRIPSIAMVKYYDQIMNNPKYPDKLKSITTELYRNIADISNDQNGKVLSALNDRGLGGRSIPNFDSLTGEQLEDVNFSLPNGLDDITKPEASKYVDLDSALICVASKNADDGKNCHSK